MRWLILAVVAVAIGVATPALAEDAEDAFRRGQKHFAAGEFRDALEAYRAAYDKAALADIVFNIAQCHRNLGEYDKAATGFDKYLEDMPKARNRAQVERTLEQLSILALARREVRSRRYDKAIERYEEALRIEPLAPIHRDLAHTFERVGNYDEALASYRDYLAERSNAEDREEIDKAIARLEKEIAAGGNGVGLAGPGGEARPPVYKEWWFWAGVGAAVVVGTVLTIALTADSVPGSDLGNVGFPGIRFR